MDRRRLRALAGTAVFTAAVPGVVLGVMPHRLARGQLSRSRRSRMLGAAVVVGGMPLVADSFVRFVKAAGTPAPVYETDDLVVDGFYRYTRNPQYVGVLTVLLGEAVLYGSRRVLAYAVATGLAFHLWVVGYEEPRLRRRFGGQYERYAHRTPRWLVR